jgi:hypothetical protein
VVFLCHDVQTGSEDCLTPYVTYVTDTVVTSAEIKGPERDTNHSPPSKVMANNAWIFISALPAHIHGVMLSHMGKYVNKLHMRILV